MAFAHTFHDCGVDNDPIRQAGLAFLRGCRLGWSAGDLASWARTELVRPGFLRLNAPLSGRFQLIEPGAPSLVVPTLGVPAAVDPTALLETAYQAVIAELRGLTEEVRDDRFVREALYAGRVQRGRLYDRGVRRWLPSLAEGMSLSQMVLALFAADVLAHRDLYDRAPTSDERDEVLALLCDHVFPPESRAVPQSGERRKANADSGEHARVVPLGRMGLGRTG